MSGAAGWLALCAGTSAFEHQPSASTVLIGAAVSAGCALAPDIDHPGSTISRSLGWVTEGVSIVTSWAADWVRDRTCGCCATTTSTAHRAGTHTVAFAVLAGLLAGVGGWRFGGWVGVPVVFVSVCLAALGLLRRRHRAGRTVLLAGVASVGAWLFSGDSWWWLGAAVGFGTLAHSLGDALTLSGVPLLWPLRVRGCRWHPCRLPRRLRFRTGSATEWWVVAALWVAAAGSAWVLVA